ncbi:MAG: hypothetical protein ABWZ25_16795 [Chitinophagaceae bacterium]
MKIFLILLFSFSMMKGRTQELFVYSDPASNIPARSVSAKISANYINSQHHDNRTMQRYLLESQAGLNKNWMIRAGAGFADVHTRQFKWESVYLYTKYRFLSVDESHRHFRMAAFAEGAYTRSDFNFDEISLTGDKSGVQLGVIATQLWNRFALSATVSHTQVLHDSRTLKGGYNPSRIYQVMNYSLSGGLLILPVKYTDYKQTNLNLYGELLAQESLDRRAYFVDFAPAVQLIFNSTTKVNAGYRFQLGSDMQRMARNSFLVGVESTILNVLKKRK